MLRFFETLDRRWLFLIMGLLVLLPLLFPLALPLTVSPRVRSFHDAIAKVPDGSTVFMPCDYDPGAIPELVPMTRTALKQLFDKRCKVVVICLWNGGAGLVDNVVRGVANENHKQDGVDYVNLGFKEGREAVMVVMGQGIANAFPKDYEGKDTRSLPIMAHVRDYTSFPLLVSISAGYPGTKEWVQQVGQRFTNAAGRSMPIVSGCTAVSAPEYYAYVSTGQLKGLLGGLAGAAEYEDLVHVKGTATRGMDGQSLAHLAIIFFILLGNGLQYFTRRGSHAA
jgi:hypothetical protein